MAKKKVKNKVAGKKYAKYAVSGDKIERKPNCPKCGPGVFMADHKDRQTCGACGYTHFKKKD